MIGRTVMPGVFMSINRKEMPSCFLAACGLVRTRQKHQSAICAVEVQPFDLMAELQSLADILRQVLADKAAHLVAKGKLFGAETEIHRGRSSVRRIYNQDWPDRATKRRLNAILQFRLVRDTRAG